MPVFKFIPRFQQHLVAPYTFRYDKSSFDAKNDDAWTSHLSDCDFIANRSVSC